MRGKPVAGETLRTSITFPRDVTERLTALAQRRGLPVAAVAREFVILGLERQAVLDRISGALDDAAEVA